MPWYPGLNAQGQKVEAGIFGMAKGFWSQPPTVVSPGTVLTTQTVTNSTGFDCMAYMSSTTGIGKIIVNSGGTIGLGGTVTAANIVIPVYVPSGQTLTLTYTGTLTWTWLAV